MVLCHKCCYILYLYFHYIIYLYVLSVFVAVKCLIDPDLFLYFILVYFLIYLYVYIRYIIKIILSDLICFIN